LTPSICDHTTPLSSPTTTLPTSRFNIIRHFTTASAGISFTLSKIDDIFELRLPHLQVTQGLDIVPSPFTHPDISGLSEKAKELRREIRKWWEGVSDHIDKIVRRFHPFLHAPLTVFF